MYSLDIILAGKSVARRAQELFCSYQVAVIQNVKAKLLARVRYVEDLNPTMLFDYRYFLLLLYFFISYLLTINIFLLQSIIFLHN